MKIIVTGSLGHISKPLTETLVQKGHTVTVISSRLQMQNDIEALGAAAAIGSLEDVDFLTSTFKGADAVYCMVPPNNYFDPALDLLAYYRKIAGNCAQAISQSGVKRAVYLSSVGAHLEKGTGLIIGHHDGEAIMNKLNNVDITFMRPVGFYYNLLGFIPAIKHQGFIEANYGASHMMIWVSPVDIAAAIVEELETPHTGRKIRYVVSDEVTGHETARILGEAIGKPHLAWRLIPGEQWKSSLIAVGMNPQIAASFIEMFESQQSGLLAEDYYRHKPAVMGTVKITDFAKEFAAVYNQS